MTRSSCGKDNEAEDLKNILNLRGVIINTQNRNNFTYYCAFCGEKVQNRYRCKSENQFCNATCRHNYYRINGHKSTCVECGKEFAQLHKNHVYCSDECKQSYKSRTFKTYEYLCDYCGEKYTTKYKRKGEKSFCSRKCYSSYSKENTKPPLSLICEYCGKEFLTKRKEQKFCGMSCQSKWQSASRTGENSSTYQWSKNSPVEYLEWIEKSSIRMTTMLSDGVFSKTNTAPQIILNKILDDLRIKYFNEYSFKYYAVDNYLCDFNLVIEVMGDYWHCNPLKYSNIKYATQKETIIKDHRKRLYFLNNHDIRILYLWERDLYNDPDKCSLLVENYVKTEGVLNNYHSFNYNKNNNSLILNDYVITPYMDYENSKLNSICNF